MANSFQSIALTGNWRDPRASESIAGLAAHLLQRGCKVTIGADLEGADFAGADLRGASLRGCSLFGASFCDLDPESGDVTTAALLDQTTQIDPRSLTRLTEGQRRFVQKCLGQ